MMLNRANIMEEIDEVMGRYCESCLVKKAKKSPQARLFAGGLSLVFIVFVDICCLRSAVSFCYFK